MVKKLDLEKHHYIQFFKDGYFSIYYDEGEETTKVETVFSEGLQVYFSSESLEDIMNAK